MRNSVAKAIRKKLYGDKSRRAKRYSRDEHGSIHRIDLGAVYKKNKRAWQKMTEAEKRQALQGQ